MLNGLNPVVCPTKGDVAPPNALFDGVALNGVLLDAFPTGVPVPLAGRGGRPSTSEEPKLLDGLNGLMLLPANPVGCGCIGFEEPPKAPVAGGEVIPVVWDERPEEENPVPNAFIPLPKGLVCGFASWPVANADARSDMAPVLPETVDECCVFPESNVNAPNSFVNPPPGFPELPKTLSKLFPPVGMVELFICDNWNNDGPVGWGDGFRSWSDGNANGFFEPVGWTESGFAMFTWFPPDGGCMEFCVVLGKGEVGKGEPVLCGTMDCRNGFGPVDCGIIGCANAFDC